VVLPVTAMWLAANIAGSQMGQAIPPEYALDFALPITFLALVSPMLRSAADLAAALVSAGGTLALIWLPYGTGLLLAAGLAMAAAVLVENLTPAKSAS
jgi:predicted branched-subunit amino acid permease